LRIIIMGTTIINKAMTSDISMSINVAEPVISSHANTKDKSISISRV